MSEHPAPPEIAKRRWYALSQRHRRIAERLRRWGYRDGAVFHAFHAYECAVSAYLIDQGRRVPASHSSRFTSFEATLPEFHPVRIAYRRLEFLTTHVRNRALYYEVDGDYLPEDRFDSSYVDNLMPLVHAFARSVWHDIR